jgi:hypothetical protein
MQLRQHFRDLFGIVDERGFGDLDDQRLGRDVPDLQRSSDLLDDAVVEDRARRQVDRTFQPGPRTQ